MRPLKLIVTGFLPFEKRTEFDLSKIHSATVTGRNGKGKSSFFIDAPLFALFGKARKRPEGLINDLCTEMSVEYYFQHREQYYLVARSIEHTKQQKLELYQINADGRERLTERLLGETQQKLNEILGISYDLLLATSIAQQEDINRLFDLKPSDRQDMIMEMLSLAYWDKKKAAIAKYLKDSDTLAEKIEKAETELAVVEGNIDVLQETLTGDRDSLAPLIMKRNTLKGEINKKQKEAGQATDRQVVETEYNVLVGKLEGMDERIKDLKKLPARMLPVEVVERLTEDIKVYQKMVKEVDAKHVKLEAEREDIRAKDIYVCSLLYSQQSTQILTRVPCVNTDYHDKCQLLSQAQGAKKEIAKYLEGLSNRFPSLEAVKKFFDERAKKIEADFKRLVDAHKSALDRQKDAEIEIDEAKSMIRDIDAGLDLRRSADTLRDQVETLKRKLAKLPEFDISGLLQYQHELETVSETITTIEKGIVAKEKEQDLSLKMVEGTKAALEQLRIEETRIASYQILHQAYGDIPAHVFGEAIPHIEAYANEILAKIDPTKRIQLRPFKETKAGTQKKSLDVVGWTGTGLRDIENLSGSERFRQGLALRVALARVNAEMYNTQIGFFIVDEGFGSLDPENIDAVRPALQEVAKQFDLFLVITHIEELKDTFDEEIHVGADKNGSTINVLKH